jgi:4-hydroxybenzoate polyprenyltransferase
MSVLFGLVGLAACFSVNRATGLVGLGYLALQVAYTLALKHVVLLDVASIASGFVLRVAAGALSISVPMSHWLYLCTLLLALFLALGKRRNELEVLEGDAASHRGALAGYSVPMVDQMMTIVTSSLILAYALYTMSDETIRRFGTDKLSWTVPLVIYGVFRYLYLVHREGAGGAPEKVLTHDKPMLTTVAIYGLFVIAVLYL